MTPEEDKQFYELIQSPPPRSKIEAAREFGIDLTLKLRNLAADSDGTHWANGSCREICRIICLSTADCSDGKK
jgi:hypothetical protein